MKNASQGGQLPDEDSIIRDPELRRLLGDCSRMTIVRWEKNGTFPKRFKLSPLSGEYGAIGWSRTEVMAWAADRRASRQATFLVATPPPRRPRHPATAENIPELVHEGDVPFADGHDG